MDLAVLAVQTWVNDKYGKVAGFQPAPLNGKTSWSTVYALTRALQVELGITSLADAFGPTTASKYKQWGEMTLGKVPTDAKGKAIVQILKGAMYCKGYNPGKFDDVFDENTKNAVVSLQKDAGLPITDGKVYDYIFKAFLTMDAYRLTPGGDAKVRQIQQDLNNKYYKTSGVQPTDGHYQRGTNKALVYGLQTEMGIAAGSQTGSIGPATRDGLPTLKEGSSSRFVTLFQYALYFNGYDSGSFSTTYNANLVNKVKEFQTFTLLPVDGVANKGTWLSTLVSTGDPDRPGTACDCSTEVTAARAQTLKSQGYQTVGRYLVNVVPGGRNKKIQVGELKTIFDAGLTVFPIYQTIGNEKGYFGKLQGRSDAAEAVYAARKYGFKPGTIIYFAVDFDALGEDINNNVIPYFEGVVQNLKQMSNGEYKVGVYGPRGVCIQVSNKFSEVVSSFVSGMSAGYSANLGYPLPKNWAFDQIKEYTIGNGAGLIPIDKNIKSGRDQGQSSVISNPLDSNALFKKKLEILHDLAMKESSTIEDANDKCLDYLRYGHYQGLAWDAVAGPLDLEFIEEAKKVLGDIENFPSLIDPTTGVELDLQHMAATCDSVITLHDAAISNYAGWAGDLMTSVRDSINMVKEDKTLNGDIYTAAFKAIGGAGTSFSYPDLISDVDAYNIARKILSSNHKISVKDAILNYFDNDKDKRFTMFYNNKFGGSADKAYKDATLYLNATEELLIPVKLAFLHKFGMSNFSKEIGEDVSRAWKDKLLKFVKEEEIILA
ncbi:glycoside hydrolase domain-containing protein [Bacillus wiedmannii]|uniref:glycoside hydrolase domain-containing protein n=1 Tax=Bacillus wiedmannii TaxID=1890302 RepID=UPI003660D07B